MKLLKGEELEEQEVEVCYVTVIAIKRGTLQEIAH